MLNTYTLAVITTFASASEVDFSPAKSQSFSSFIKHEEFYPQAYKETFKMPHNEHRNTHEKGIQAKRYASIDECRTIIAQFEDCMQKGWGYTDQEL